MWQLSMTLILKLPQEAPPWYETHNTHTLDIHWPTLNIHTPGLCTLLVCVILIMLGVCDPGMVTNLLPSPALIPARASVPPSPSSPPEPSPVVHCILPSAYRNITKDWNSLIARTH